VSLYLRFHCAASVTKYFTVKAGAWFPITAKKELRAKEMENEFTNYIPCR
jgi:hypothetical protein